MPINTPPVLAGQMKSSDKEVATAQEQMVQAFTSEQEKSAAARQEVNTQIAAGEDLQVHIYKNHLPSCHYVFKDGSSAVFVDGVFKTANPYEIEQLDKEVRLNHPHIYIDRTVPSIVSAAAIADPMSALREKIRAEILAESAARDMGSNQVQDGTALKPSSSDVMGVLGVASNNGSQQNALPASLQAALNKAAPR